MHPTFPADRTTGRRESVRVQANHGPDGQTVHHVYKFSAYPETSGDRKGPSHGVRGTALKGETESTSGEAVRSSDVGLDLKCKTKVLQKMVVFGKKVWYDV